MSNATAMEGQHVPWSIQPADRLREVVVSTCDRLRSQTARHVATALRARRRLLLDTIDKQPRLCKPRGSRIPNGLDVCNLSWLSIGRNEVDRSVRSSGMQQGG